jgi:VWFA-related protein
MIHQPNEFGPRCGAKWNWNIALILLLVPMLLAGTATAQQTVTSTEQIDQAPTIRTTTRLVQLNAVVLDKQSRPVTDLGREDFKVFDNGMEQRIVHFSAAAGVPAEPSKTSPLSISNRHSPRDEAPGVTVILVDELILDPSLVGWIPPEATAPIRRARLQVIEYLSTIQPGQQVALYALRPEGTVVIHDFTDDPLALVAAAKTLGTPSSHGKVVTVDDVMAIGEHRTLQHWPQNPMWTAMFQGHTISQAEDLERGMRRKSFDAIIRHLEGVPGRKNLVWISQSLPDVVTDLNINEMLNAVNQNLAGITRGGVTTPKFPDPQNHFNEMRSFGRRLGDANIAVYPIDANGLSTGGENYTAWSGADLIASESGGRAIFDSNSIVDALAQIVAESSDAYQIGYYPGDQAWDGKYHRIEVKLAPEQKGFKLLCRKGYTAVDTPPVSDSAAPLREAAISPVEAPGIGVTLNVPTNPLEWGPEDVVLKLNVHDLHFVQADDRSKARLDVAFVQLGSDGHVIEGFKDHIQLAFQSETYSDAREQGWFYQRKLNVAPSTEKLRVVVRDLATGSVGSVSVPVHPYSDKNAK